MVNVSHLYGGHLPSHDDERLIPTEEIKLFKKSNFWPHLWLHVTQMYLLEKVLK
jgi:hypothetical protein